MFFSCNINVEKKITEKIIIKANDMEKCIIMKKEENYFLRLNLTCNLSFGYKGVYNYN